VERCLHAHLQLWHGCAHLWDEHLVDFERMAFS
jgi:hypothetical protein